MKASSTDLEPFLAALREAWDEGSPVAHPPWNAFAQTALRRWRSFASRGLEESDREGRIRDLAKGLIARFESDPALVGALKVDYEYVARAIADRVDPALPDSTQPAG